MKKCGGKKEKEGISYWLSYSDMMAALLLVFALMISITMYQARIDLEMQGQELQDAKDEIEDIVGIRRDIIEKLLDEFGNDGDITIDSETGDIMFSSQILFDVDKYDLKTGGKTFLNDFFPRYIKILMSDGIKEHISEIIVEGHTDPQSGYLYNLNLSQQRALSVVTYCMTSSNNVLSEGEINYLQTVLSSNGKSFSELKYYDDEKTKIDYDSSRRVEVKFRLADEGQIDKIIEMIQERLN